MPETYGRLTVIGDAPKIRNRPTVLCRCECGAEIAVVHYSLRCGNTRSCGCLHREQRLVNIDSRQRLSHGLSKTKEYQAWANMKNRVLGDNQRNRDYYKFVKVFPGWLDDFEAFLTHIGPSPSGQHTVDRIRSDGNYEPGNVRWSTAEEQNRNKRNNIFIEWKDTKYLLVDAAKEAGLPYYPVYRRIVSLGWAVDRALSTPINEIRSVRS